MYRIGIKFIEIEVFPGGSVVKKFPAIWKSQVRFLGWKDPLEKETATHSSVLAEKSHGQRSLEGYNPRDRKSQTRLSN